MPPTNSITQNNKKIYKNVYKNIKTTVFYKKEQKKMYF